MGSKRKADDFSDLSTDTSRPPLHKRSTTQDLSNSFPGTILFADGSAQLNSSANHHQRADSVFASATPPFPDKEPIISRSNNSNGFVPSSLMNSMLSDSSTSISTFQLHLTEFCTRCGDIFGAAYVSTLKDAHWAVASSNDHATILVAGQTFLRTLNGYVEDLQAAAIQQIQVRGRIAEIGVGKAAIEAIDATLAQLDAHIIGIGEQASGLIQELAVLEHEFRSGDGETMMMQV